LHREIESKNAQLENSSEESASLKDEIKKTIAQKNDLAEQLGLAVKERSQLVKKIDDFNTIEEGMLKEINELKEEQKKLLDSIEKFRKKEKNAYALDKEKLDELKEFTLEAIQARRWKSAEFVNGAYDAIGLFYRSLLADRPIKKR